MAHYAGEDRVLLSKNTYQKLFLIFSSIFPEGAPIDSMLYVHNGFFRICGEISSIAGQWRSTTFFLKKMFTKMLCDPNSVDLQNLSIKNI